MENEMVERVARALATARLCSAAVPDEEDRIAARAAIEAMRQPTEGMIEAGLSRAGDLIEAGTSTDYLVSETLQAVIDAALTPETKNAPRP